MKVTLLTRSLRCDLLFHDSFSLLGIHISFLDDQTHLGRFVSFSLSCSLRVFSLSILHGSILLVLAYLTLLLWQCSLR